MTNNAFYVLKKAEPLLHRAFCLENGIEIDEEEILNIIPSASTYRDIIRDGAAHCVYENIQQLKKNPYVWLTADKGTEKKGKKYSLMPKLLCFYDPSKKKVQEILLDVGSSGGTSTEAALAVKFSLDHLLSLDEELLIVIMGVATDSGGGGKLGSFLRALKRAFQNTPRVSIVINAEFLSFSEHNVQTCLQTAIKSVFGDSGTTTNDKGEHITFKKNTLQLIYGIANLNSYVDKFLLETMWRVTCDKLELSNKYKTINKPCLTRWWTVGVAVANMTDTRNV